MIFACLIFLAAHTFFLARLFWPTLAWTTITIKLPIRFSRFAYDSFAMTFLLGWLTIILWRSLARTSSWNNARSNVFVLTLCHHELFLGEYHSSPIPCSFVNAGESPYMLLHHSITMHTLTHHRPPTRWLHVPRALVHIASKCFCK